MKKAQKHLRAVLQNRVLFDQHKFKFYVSCTLNSLFNQDYAVNKASIQLIIS